MKRFITTITLLIALVGSVFATDWVKKGTYENQTAGVYSVYYDFDATSPMDGKSIDDYFEYLQGQYKKVDIAVFSKEEVEKLNFWSLSASKHNCYKTLEDYTNYVIEDWVYDNGSVIEFICYK